MRSVLALLIVFTHAFTCYNGSWEPPVGYVDIPLYKWLTRISFAFTLEAFVFISGYLFAFQRITLKREEGLYHLIINKAKRLILPCIVFGLVYFIIFLPYKGVGDAVYSILNGCGHLWFLPMLFWCFIGCWLIEKIPFQDGMKFAVLVLLNLLMLLPLPLRLNNASSFLVYFYGGFLCYKYKEQIYGLITPNRIIWSWIVFIVLFAVLRPIRDVLVTSEDQTIIQRLFVHLGNRACQFSYAWAGLIAFYSTVVDYTKRHQLSKITFKVGACCFGIYLFQQFILLLLYYHTNFPSFVGPYLLPWCGFAIAITFSWILTDLLRRTRLGKALL